MNYLNLIAMAVPTDGTGFTFWLGAMAMMAASVFFFLSMNSVDAKWRTSLLVSGLITFIAAVHYMYMRDAHAAGDSTTVFRYVDWLLTVPLQIVEFYLILAAIAVVSISVFWRLLIASVVMLVAGYIGEVSAMGDGGSLWSGFWIGMVAWLYIIWEVFKGEASQISASKGTVASKKAFNALRLIVTVGWAIYPIGYYLGYTGSADAGTLNIVYNLADFVNKIAFGVVIWAAATSGTKAK